MLIPAEEQRRLNALKAMKESMETIKKQMERMETKENRKQRIIFLKGKKVVLRPLNKKTDLEKSVRWINDQEIMQYLSSLYLPMSTQAEEQWFDGQVDKQNEVPLAIETLDGVYIGNTSLYSISWKDRVAMHGALIGEKEYWGKGYGTDVKMTLMNYAFNELNLRKVCVQVTGFNKRSLRYNEKCGLKVVGRLKKHVFRNGEYHDEFFLEAFKEDWLPYWKKHQKAE